MAINVALQRIYNTSVGMLLQILVGIQVIEIISLTKIMLNVMVWMMNMQTLVEVSRSMNFNIIVGELVTDIIHTMKIISQTQLLLLLLQLMDEVTMLFHDSMKACL